MDLKFTGTVDAFGSNVWPNPRNYLTPSKIILACCRKLLSTNSYEDNGVYVRNGSVVNGHPLFVGASAENRDLGIWFKEDAYGPDWVRGGLKEMSAGWYGYGYQLSNSYELCPGQVFCFF